jgi:hypothetical protein
LNVDVATSASANDREFGPENGKFSNGTNMKSDMPESIDK